MACFDRQMSIRATALATRTARRTASRYYRIWRRTRVRGLPPGPGDRSESVVSRPGPAVARRLAEEAERRGVARHDLVADLLEAITEADLFDAVLGGERGT